jgi:hypothetical protein
MHKKGEYVNPWESDDPALALALEWSRGYNTQANIARYANQISEVLLLIVSASTTVAAALAATAWVTAMLAAAALILAGLRRSFDWHEVWLSCSSTWSALQPVIHQYRLLPETERDNKAQQDLMSEIDRILSSETKSWASRRREIQA